MPGHNQRFAGQRARVAFVPSDSFYANDGRKEDGREGVRHMRLNFSNAAPKQTREGIRRLATAVKNHLTAVTFLPELPVGV
jgi:DNA-binding transcriptional MocR family regulator